MNEKAEMIGCPLAEALRWQGQREEAGAGRHGGECVRRDLQSLNLKAEWAQDRTKWKGLFWGNRPTRASTEKRTLNR